MFLILKCHLHQLEMWYFRGKIHSLWIALPWSSQLWVSGQWWWRFLSLNISFSLAVRATFAFGCLEKTFHSSFSLPNLVLSPAFPSLYKAYLSIWAKHKPRNCLRHLHLPHLLIQFIFPLLSTFLPLHCDHRSPSHHLKSLDLLPSPCGLKCTQDFFKSSIRPADTESTATKE